MLNEFDSLIPIWPYIITSIDAVNKTVQWKPVKNSKTLFRKCGSHKDLEHTVIFKRGNL